MEQDSYRENFSKGNAQSCENVLSGIDSKVLSGLKRPKKGNKREGTNHETNFRKMNVRKTPLRGLIYMSNQNPQGRTLADTCAS